MQGGLPATGNGGHVRLDSLAIDLDDFLDANDPRGRLLEAEAERRLAWFCYVLALYEEPYRTTSIRVHLIADLRRLRRRYRLRAPAQ